MKKVYVFPQPLVMTYFYLHFTSIAVKNCCCDSRTNHRGNFINSLSLRKFSVVRQLWVWPFELTIFRSLRSFVNSVTHVLKNLRTQNLRTETGVRTFVNSTPGSEDQYTSLYAKCCADRSNRCRDIVIFILLGCWPPPSSISLYLKFVTDQSPIGHEGRTASPCQISSRSLKPPLRYINFSIFPRWRRPPSWILEFINF